MTISEIFWFSIVVGICLLALLPVAALLYMRFFRWALAWLLYRLFRW